MELELMEFMAFVLNENWRHEAIHLPKGLSEECQKKPL